MDLKNFEFSSPTLIFLIVHLCFQYMFCSFRGSSRCNFTILLKFLSGTVRGLASSRESNANITLLQSPMRPLTVEILVCHVFRAFLRDLNLAEILLALLYLWQGLFQLWSTHSMKPGKSTQ